MGGEAKFEIYKDKAGDYRFRLVSEDGKTFFASDSFPTKEDCIEQIELYKKLVNQASIEDRIERAQFLMSETVPEVFHLKVGQPVALGEEIIAQKNRDGLIVLYEVVR